MESTVGKPDEREKQFELIANHLACTDMKVHFSDSNRVIRVDFPARPTLQ